MDPCEEDEMNVSQAAGVTNQNNDELLRQIEREFSCLGVENRDVLIKQLQKIIGPQLNSYAAQFFLDMNDWNLQLAVGSYFDLVGNTGSTNSIGTDASGGIVGSTSAFSAEILSDKEIAVKDKMYKFWVRIKNNGNCQWPIGSHLRFIQGDEIHSQGFTNVPLQNLEPSASTNVELEVVNPTEIGSIRLVYQMCTPDGYLFGELLTVILNPTNNVDSVANQFNRMST